jgi:hypothetical protein
MIVVMQLARARGRIIIQHSSTPPSVFQHVLELFNTFDTAVHRAVFRRFNIVESDSTLLNPIQHFAHAFNIVESDSTPFNTC